MMPDSPVFPGDFSIQGNLGISQPYIPFPCCQPRQSLVASWMQCPALATCPPSSRAGRRTSLGTRTRLSNVQDLAEDQGELDAASGKGTFVFVFPAAVLEDKLEKRAMTLLHGFGGLPQEWVSDMPHSSCIPSQAAPTGKAIPNKSDSLFPKSSPSLLLLLWQCGSWSQALQVRAWLVPCWFCPNCPSLLKAWKPSCGQTPKNYGDPLEALASNVFSYPREGLASI